jgi:ketosteroid isomerase-like protein
VGSEENTEIVRRMYEAFNRGDWDAVLADLSESVEFETDPRHPKAGTYRGREAFHRFWADIEEPFDETVVEVEELFPQADQVVAFVKIRRRPRRSTADFEIHIGELWTLHARKIVRGQAFGERQKALEALGLRA